MGRISMNQELLLVEGVSKSFGGVLALDRVDFSVRRGEIHGLVGQNGSGKSTLIKILSGYHQPDAGQGAITYKGGPVELPFSRTSEYALSFAAVHQDLGLVDTLCVLENILVGRYQKGRFGAIDLQAEAERVKHYLRTLGVDLDPWQSVSSLDSMQRAQVAIARALGDAEGVADAVVVLDEPTVYLPREDIDTLGRLLRLIAGKGAGVVYVSHKLPEVLAIADRITILRDGHVVITAGTQGLTESELITTMLGRQLSEMYPQASRDARQEVALSVEGLSGSVCRDVSFTVRRGEILGLTGLMGGGHDELPYLLSGAVKASGRMELSGRSFDLASLTPPRAASAGIALLPANRLRDGLVPTLSVGENVSVTSLRQFMGKLHLRLGSLREWVVGVIRRFNISPGDPDVVVTSLSGGNQQKVVLAKWLALKPDILLLHEPTQGVDVGARHEIYGIINAESKEGRTVLVSTGDFDEVAHLCGRVLIFCHGSLAGEIAGGVSGDVVEDACYRASSR